jgi:hypothetical protein
VVKNKVARVLINKKMVARILYLAFRTQIYQG